MKKQTTMRKSMERFNTLIEKGYQIDWKETKNKGSKTLIVLEK